MRRAHQAISIDLADHEARHLQRDHLAELLAQGARAAQAIEALRRDVDDVVQPSSQLLVAFRTQRPLEDGNDLGAWAAGDEDDEAEAEV
jgi:hypothetical protein